MNQNSKGKKYSLLAIIASICLLIQAVLFLMPVVVTFANSFMSTRQISSHRSIMDIIPFPATLRQYIDILVEYHNYLYMFWQSLKIALIITVCHIIVSVVTGFLFGKFQFRGKNIIFVTYVIVLFMPFSVTLLPNYLLIKWLQIFDTQWALILPAIFSPLGTILMTMLIKDIPNEYYEASLLETNSIFKILYKMLLPLIAPGIGALITLTFAEAWNMVEQPQVLIEDILLQPLSVALNSIYGQYTSAQFAGAVIYFIPVLFLFFYFEDTIIEEIGVVGIGGK